MTCKNVSILSEPHVIDFLFHMAEHGRVRKNSFTTLCTNYLVLMKVVDILEDAKIIVCGKESFGRGALYCELTDLGKSVAEDVISAHKKIIEAEQGSCELAEAK